jgi:hypothetical protein
MRTATFTLAGLLTAALVPLSLDHHPQSTPAPRISQSIMGPSIQASVLTALATAKRNSEIERSLIVSKLARGKEFAVARNREIDASIIASAAARPALFAAARMQELDAWRVRAEKFQIAVFVAARNAEIELSMARVAGDSNFVALARIAPYIAQTGHLHTRNLDAGRIETGSIKTLEPAR